MKIIYLNKAVAFPGQFITIDVEENSKINLIKTIPDTVITPTQIEKIEMSIKGKNINEKLVDHNKEVLEHAKNNKERLLLAVHSIDGELNTYSLSSMAVVEVSKFENKDTLILVEYATPISVELDPYSLVMTGEFVKEIPDELLKFSKFSSSLSSGEKTIRVLKSLKDSWDSNSNPVVKEFSNKTFKSNQKEELFNEIFFLKNFYEIIDVEGRNLLKMMESPSIETLVSLIENDKNNLLKPAYAEENNVSDTFVEFFKNFAESSNSSFDIEEEEDVEPDTSSVKGLISVIMKRNLKPEVKKEFEKVARSMKTINPMSSEYSSTLSYLETVNNLAWGEKLTTDEVDLDKIQEFLDNEHYGLSKIKERFIEYIAVKNMKNDLTAPIICLVGPPGVGKTTLAKSLAGALNRKFVKIALGGITDESAIRGHRRTYVASMPGQIIKAFVDAETDNPLILLDEIDKASSQTTSSGNVSAALLEVLDPSQNTEFKDNFLGLPYDLSKTIFIATANDESSIPGPLRDRMEIIRLSSYSIDEKKHIGLNYLVPTKLKEVGVEVDDMKITEEMIDYIIESYTMEAGVRRLSQVISTLARKVAVVKARGKELPVVVDKEIIKEWVGAPYDGNDIIHNTPTVGVVNGLAYSSVGGGVLQLEAVLVPGSGKIVITGKLGQVMSESANIAHSLVKSRYEELGIDPEKFTKFDVHIHAPEGSVPKDGPSAGVTFSTLLASVYSGKKVRQDIAMTGEISLLGKVLPIGGLKEKSFAAYKSGIKEIFIPYNNRNNVQEAEDIVKQNVKFTPVKSIEEIFEVVFQD